MRVVVLSSTYSDPATRGKLRALAGLGCAVTVGVPDRWLQPGKRRPVRVAWGDDAGVRVAPIPVRLAGGRSTWSRGAIRRLVTDARPDLVHIEEEPWTVAASAGTAAAVSLDLPSVVYMAESVPRPLPLLDRWRRRRTLRRVAGIVAANQLAAGLATRDAPAIPAVVLPQLGVAPPVMVERSQHQGLSIGFIGRLVPERGLDLVFRACVRLLGHWTITVIGTGPAQEELERLAAQLGIAARVLWLGAVPAAERERVWPHLDCVVLPARSTPRWVEATGRPLLEAMARGIAVVGSRSGAIPEIVADGGLLVPEDDAAALAAALQRLADHPREREEFGAAGRRRILADYADDALARRTLAFWESVRKRLT
ncbi:MAG TPA: glycosyltransferase [Gemmatimonadales bacterium]|nr:glycosyltransferase [Gemmatimonadales bacterium]